MDLFRGVYVALVTPFSKTGEIDSDAFRRHVAELINAGVDGLVPCGTTGESPTLSRKDRRQLIEICLEMGRERRVPVVAGCGGNSTETVRDLIGEAEELGCEGTLVVTPYYNKPTPAGLLSHYLHLAEHSRKPLLLYHVPGRTNVWLPLETVNALFEHPRIAGIKEASGQYSYWLGLSEIARSRKKAIFAGDDDAFATLQILGGQGIISASANVVAPAYVQMYRYMQQGEWARAFRLQAAVVPLVRALFLETNPAPVKWLLHHQSKMENCLRLPLVPVASATEKKILGEWERFQEVSRDL